MSELGVGLVGAALLYGFRHGFDLDHLAAISDIGASSVSRHRSITLSTFYIAGHAAVVLVLGTLAVVAGAQVPAALDDMMGRVVGFTLIALGIVVGYRALRGRDVRLRSTWMAAAAGVHALSRRFHRSTEVVIIEHSHAHDHDGTHDHVHEPVPLRSAGGNVATVAATHTHTHRHVGRLPRDPFAGYSAAGASLIGVVHGVGAETPSQILLFASAAGTATVAGGLAVLIAFVAGLVTANCVIAAASAFGLVTPQRWPRAYRVIALTAALVSLVLGAMYVAGIEPATYFAV